LEFGQDFRNLVDVYLDAVFHPRCMEDELVFQQEGWHFEVEEPAEPITFKGAIMITSAYELRVIHHRF
jgi:hypothetical protein